MSRTAGAKNADYEARRAALLDRLRARLAARDARPPSLRELAAAAGVSVPTLNHYFGSRDGIVAAVLGHGLEQGQTHLRLASTAHASFAESVRQLLLYAAAGHRAGVAQLHAIGLTEGIGNPRLGPSYLDSILEPSLQAIEARLKAHRARGEMRDTDVRAAALALIAPLLLAQLHQDQLGGGVCRPLDLDAFVEHHAEAFVRAYAN